MRYRYTALYRIRGVALRPDAPARELFAEPTRGIRALLTANPNDECSDIDRGNAISTITLNRLYRGSDMALTMENLASETETLRAARAREFGPGPYLVVHQDGDAQPLSLDAQVELEQFVICLDAFDKRPLRQVAALEIRATIAALALGLGTVEAVDLVTSGVVFHREDGKPLYSFAFEASGELTVGRAMSDGAVSSVGTWYAKVRGSEALQRVARLIVASLEARADRLRSFLAAWTALEILVNKIFSQYEARFFAPLVDEGAPHAQRGVVDRIRSVMSGRYNPSDRFAVISSLLCPDETDADVIRFRAAKKARDEMTHGEDVEERRLPDTVARDLALKYLRLHLEGEA